jgi:hypothetical protein
MLEWFRGCLLMRSLLRRSTFPWLSIWGDNQFIGAWRGLKLVTGELVGILFPSCLVSFLSSRSGASRTLLDIKRNSAKILFWFTYWEIFWNCYISANWKFRVGLLVLYSVLFQISRMIQLIFHLGQVMLNYKL